MSFIRDFLSGFKEGYNAKEPVGVPYPPEITEDIESLADRLEMQDFVGTIVAHLYLTKDGTIPDDTLGCFSDLTERQKEFAFLILVGVVQGLITPPENDLVIT